MGTESSVEIHSARIYKAIGLKKLVIISHTGHQIDSKLGIVGWGPTIREINFLSRYWDEVVHLACLDSTVPLGSSLPYLNNNIQFIPIPNFGGKHLFEKFDIIWKVPGIVYKIHKVVKGASEVQVRLPMGIGLFVLLYFKLRGKKGFLIWIKFATNWGQRSSSISTRVQRFILNRNWLDCPVTINGKWADQPSHCKSFENPCLTNEQFDLGGEAILNKSFNAPFTFIFVGRLDESKGIDLLINSLTNLPLEKIKHIHIVGDGALRSALQSKLLECEISNTFHGWIPQESIVELYKECNFILLPSRSEGFPKVVAEALNYGCIPIVSSVGSIPFYIENGKNGFLINFQTHEKLCSIIANTLTLSSEQLQYVMNEGKNLAELFTYENYLKKLKSEIFNVI